MVTVIIPCFNGESVIDRSLESVIDQKYSMVEIIIVDDGSTDQSKKKIDQWSDKIKQKGWTFKYIYEENRGLGGAIDTGLKYVTGKYLTLLDIDDYFLPDSIYLKAKFLDEHPDYAGVRSNGWIERADGSRTLLVHSDEEKSNLDLFSALIYGTTNNWAGTYMVRTDNLFDFYKDRNIFPSRNGQNMQILLPVAYGRKFGFIDMPLFVYCLHNNSLSQAVDPNEQFMKEETNAIGYREIYLRMLQIILGNDPKEYQRYLNAFNASDSRTAMNRAIKYKHKKAASINYCKLKKTGLINLNDKIAYYSFTNPAIAIMLRIRRKLENRIWRA